MLNIKNIQRALLKYAGQDDEQLARTLAVYGAVLQRAAQLAKDAPGPVPEWTPEEISAARLGKAVLLSERPVVLDPVRLEAVARDLAQTFIDAAGLTGKERAACEAVDWAGVAAKLPSPLDAEGLAAFLPAAAQAAGNEGLGEIFVLPVTGFALRVLLDAAGTEASRAIDALEPDTVHAERPLRCPVCGSAAAIASVAGTMRNGNVKKLYCTCCGASWKFERIRCALCGDEAVSDLSYVHDEGDEAHRLHVCKSCGGAMPTVFAGEELQFNPDVEGMVMSALENYYDAEAAGAK